MKKSFIYSIAALLSLLLAACGGDDEPSGGGNGSSGGGLSGNADGHEWVDLGLTSGTLWATMNVGASKPEDYGDYFAWGETQPKSEYGWSTYKWGDYSKLTKYCTESSYGKDGFVDGKTLLDPDDDAATVNWGNKWRMPTKEQQIELRAECTWQWTSLNGVNGYIVASKSNSNSIFLPVNNVAGSRGYYWSRTLDKYRPDSAYFLYFYSDKRDWDTYYRSYGYSVRAVRVSQN
ncbi:MAG: hypothetical protein IJP59_05020 [Muribaculaceae bacterium]|nr:hypothetical protein [Muribaculaceae bacterium]